MTRPRLVVFVASFVILFIAYRLGIYSQLSAVHIPLAWASNLLGGWTHLFHLPRWHSQVQLDEPERHARPFSRHIVAVGDMHGDLPNALKVLKFSGVVDEFGNWTGNVDFFVQTGDIIDR